MSKFDFDSSRVMRSPDEVNPNVIEKETFLPASSVLELFLFKMKLRYLNSETSFASRKCSITASLDEIRQFFSSSVFIHNIVNNKDLYYFPEEDTAVTCGKDDAMLTLFIYGTPENTQGIVDQLNKKFEPPESYVRWIFDPQYLESMNVAIPNRNYPFDEMYPFLNGEPLEEYYDRFMASDAAILLLLGPPGTGKTSFLRGLLHHTKQNAILTYHTKLLEQDDFFAEWFKSDNENIVIMEDSDTLLLPRTDGNSMMQRFLNLGDGLLSITGKKMIFTTNLPNTSSIDEALTRPGRCHDILEFRPLSINDAKAVANKAKITLNYPPDKNELTIAEIFSDVKTRKTPRVVKQNFGFI